MKQNIIIFQFVVFVLLQGLLNVKSEDFENKRKWLEIGKTLYRIEPEGKYTWKQAEAECTRELSTLICPQGDYDYSKLYYFIKQNFRNYSSFWTNSKVKVEKPFLAQIGFQTHNQVKCNRFENTAFRYGQDECEKSLGFICEKNLTKDASQFHTINKKFYIQPEKKFTCGQALHQCTNLNMKLVLYDEFYENNTALGKYIDLNYGSSPRFWLAHNDKYEQCSAAKESMPVNTNTQFGFICERTRLHASISIRHLVLIAFVSIAAILAIIVFLIIRCHIRKQINSYVSEIPEPVYMKSDTKL